MMDIGVYLGLVCLVMFPRNLILGLTLLDGDNSTWIANGQMDSKMDDLKG